MITLLVVRHGEAEGNPDGRFIGQMDVPLTAMGRHQVEKLAGTLLNRGITRVISSDLQRAADTVRPVAEALGLSIELEPRLREIANGHWAGLMADEIAERWPDLFAAYRAGVDVPREGGERWQDVQYRVRQAVTEITASCRHDEVVLVGTHAGPVLSLARWAMGEPPVGTVFSSDFPPLANTAICTFQMDDSRLRLIEFNRTAHL